jgi:hypothetical protein
MYLPKLGTRYRRKASTSPPSVGITRALVFEAGLAATVKQDWATARVWLRHEMSKAGST